MTLALCFACPAAQATTGPVVALGFDEGSGAVTRDASGNGNDGTLREAAWSSAGRYGSALSFDGVNDWVTVADANSLDVTRTLTIEAWVKPRVSQTWDNVLMKEAPSGLAYALYATQGSGKPRVELGTAGGLAGPNALPTGAWSHVAVTDDGSTVRLYVNGLQVATRVSGTAAPATTGALRIGGDATWAGEFFDGLIDEVRIYDRALTATDVTTDMNTPIGVGSGGGGGGTPPVTQPDPTLAAAGDIACDPADTTDPCRAAATAQLLQQLNPTVVAPLGDNQYSDGALAKYNAVYDPTWGRQKARTRPVMGNEEYMINGATGYFDYFGAAAGPRGKGWYSYDVGSWHVVVLNSECSDVACAAGSEQEQWLRADLAAHPAQCSLAYWHRPRFTSGRVGNYTPMSDLWKAFYSAGGDIVLSGHQHEYERFAPMNATGAATLGGTRQFVVGTGGASLFAGGSTLSTSQARNSATFGVLLLTLRNGAYDWRFVPESSSGFTDSGSGNCSGASVASVRRGATAGGVTSTRKAPRVADDDEPRQPPLPSARTRITRRPAGTVSTTAETLRVKFGFSVKVRGASLRCSLDGKRFTPCRSRLTWTVRPGTHTLTVRAVTRTGRLAAMPATARFTVTRLRRGRG